MKVKVCGMTDIAQLRMLESLGVDFAGFIFYKRSKRFAEEKISNQQSAISNLNINKVGVFVNTDINKIKETVAAYHLQYVQLHGDETPEFCKTTQQFIPVIKAIRVSADMDLQKEINNYQAACDYFLFDTDSRHYGGSGKRFNWEVLQSATINKPFFLSGGIGPEAIIHLKNFMQPDLFAVDINSRFEVSPGIKDMALVEQFIHAIKKYNGENKPASKI